MRYSIRGWMWWSRIAQLVSRVVFYAIIALTVAVILCLVLIAYFQSIGLMAEWK